MKARLVASLALITAVIAASAGCTFITPQSTTTEYSASDGVNVDDAGPVVVRNALVIANDEGTAGNLMIAAINTSTTSQTLSIQLEGATPQSVTVAAGESLVLGGDSAALTLTGFSGKPGAVVTIYFQSGDEIGRAVQVPVLDGTLPYYKKLVP